MANKMRLIDATDWDSFYADMGDSRNTMDSYDRGYTDAFDRVDDWMNAQPTVDAAPVVHGRWIPCENGGYYCSNCDRRVAFLIHNRYCPNCGAKMDGGVSSD